VSKDLVWRWVGNPPLVPLSPVCAVHNPVGTPDAHICWVRGCAGCMSAHHEMGLVALECEDVAEVEEK
jgi:hypothetical protein